MSPGDAVVGPVSVGRHRPLCVQYDDNNVSVSGQQAKEAKSVSV